MTISCSCALLTLVSADLFLLLHVIKDMVVFCLKGLHQFLAISSVESKNEKIYCDMIYHVRFTSDYQRKNRTN